MRALTDYPQACQCVRGATQSAAFRAVPKTCAAQDTLEMLVALEKSCAFEPDIQSALSKALNGCTDADVVRAELVGMQLLDCTGATGSDMAGSTAILDEGRIAQIANCVNKPGYSNPDCLALIGSLAKIASNHPDTLEAEMVEKMTKQGKVFCGCIDSASKSAPAQAISPTCNSPYSGIQFLRNNKQYCDAIAAVPPSFWTAVAAGIASAASSDKASVPIATTGTNATTSVNVPASGGAQVTASSKKDGGSSVWDYMPDVPNVMPDFPDISSMMSFFSASNTAGGKEEDNDRKLNEAPEEEHPHLRFKGNANKQSKHRQSSD